MKLTTSKHAVLQILVIIVLLLIGVAGIWALKTSQKSVHKYTHETPLPLARVKAVTVGPYAIILTGYGTVQPLREIDLSPQVAGIINQVSPSLVNGGTFFKGDLLAEIDSRDYKVAVTLAQSRLKDTESKYAQIQEEAAAAREEWRQVHGNTAPPPLAAKEPQLAAANAQLEAARAELTRARLQLERTRILAPFDGQVGQIYADLGQYVAPGQKVARLYATEAAEIVVPMAQEDLFWFHVPGFTSGSGPGADVEVQAQVAGRTRTWQGRVVRAQGKLDVQTRMVQVVVYVQRPYDERPPLAAGLFVKVYIQGRILENAAHIPRSALHDTTQVWVVDEGDRLQFRHVEVARLTSQGAVVHSGLESGERIVVSTIKGASNGMQVKPVEVSLNQ